MNYISQPRVLGAENPVPLFLDLSLTRDIEMTSIIYQHKNSTDQDVFFWDKKSVLNNERFSKIILEFEPVEVLSSISNLSITINLFFFQILLTSLMI